MKIPGLVDLQVNGYAGVDFSSPDLTETDFIAACEQLFESGTTAFLPTMITSPEYVYERNLAIMAAVLERAEFRGRLPGVHLEGPFISPQEGARGAHNSEWIRKPDLDYFERLTVWADGKVKLITIAAEVDGAEQLAKHATSKGIVVSLGHQMAAEKDLEKLAQAGAMSLTHLGNGIPAVMDRHENSLWAGLGNDDLSAMIITDGNHLPASLVKAIIRTKGPARCIVVSDGSPLAGFKPGRYKTLGHKVVLEESGRLYDPATGYLVGSSATMLECMNWLASLKLAWLDELIAVGFYNPLKLIGLSAKDITQDSKIWLDEKQQAFCMEK